MRAEVRWSKQARSDLQAAVRWFRERDQGTAIQFANSIKEVTHLLAEFPHMGAIALDLEPRGRYRHVMKGHYRILYRVDGEVVRILRVWDTRRNPDDFSPNDRST